MNGKIHANIIKKGKKETKKASQSHHYLQTLQNQHVYKEGKISLSP